MKQRTPFTLIELLTVVAIIAILAGILLPAVGTAKQRAKITRARAQAKALQLAIRMYETEYGFLPVAGSGDTVLTDTQYTNLIKDLSCADSANVRKNPRGIVFLEVQNNTGQYSDPWNLRFSVVLDLGYDGQIADDATNGPWEDVTNAIAIWSWGPNGANNLGRDAAQGSSYDDIATWNE